jgi:hypothetical protein
MYSPVVFLSNVYFRSVVVDELMTRHDQEKGIGIAYHYFTYAKTDDGGQTALHVLSSLCKQIITSSNVDIADANMLYDRLRPKNQRPTVPDLTKLLLSVSEHGFKNFIVLDALNHCPDRPRDSELEDILMVLTELSIANYKICVTSRPNAKRSITRHFVGAPTILISADDTEIRKYLARAVKGESSINVELKQKIVDKIANDAKGL